LPQSIAGGRGAERDDFLRLGVSLSDGDFEVDVHVVALVSLVVDCFPYGLQLADHLLGLERDLFDDVLGGVILELERVELVFAVGLVDDEVEGVELFEVDDLLLAAEFEVVVVLVLELGGAMFEVENEEEPEGGEEFVFGSQSYEADVEVVLSLHDNSSAKTTVGL
jgi:hypothetical protein